MTDSAGSQESRDEQTVALAVRYDILGELGRGGMGTVYKARDRETATIIAVKLLHPLIAGQPELIERFRNELVLARRITHKNVCRVYDLNRFDKVVAISMEYIEGESLRTVLDRAQGLSIRHGLNLVRQVLAGLAEAHAQGVVHRDLKPENIVIAKDGTVKVMDFGIAQPIDSEATRTGSFAGTPAYMSPEQVEGKPVDARSDIYALGLLIYEMFCGQRTFTGETPFALAMKQVQETPPRPRELEPHLPVFLERLILKCIEKIPANRFQSIAELEAALADTQEAAAVAAASDDADAPVPAHFTRWQRSDWLLLPLAVMGLLLFFPFYQRTHLAPRTPVSFDRSVLRKIAQDYAQKLGAPIGQESQIRVLVFPDQYAYIAERSGAAAALELANNPVPYWLWQVEWENGTSVAVDNQGALKRFHRDFPPGLSILAGDMRGLHQKSEELVRDYFGAGSFPLDSITTDTWQGYPSFKYTLPDPKNRLYGFGGVHRQYIVRFVGEEVALLESVFSVPLGYVRPDILWHAVPGYLGIPLILLAVGYSQRHRVNADARWRTVLVAVVSLSFGGSFALILLAVGASMPITLGLSLIEALTSALVMFFITIALERAMQRMGPGKLSSVIRLFDRRILSELCGFGILRGTLIGLALAGTDGFLVWIGTNYLGMWSDSLALAPLPTFQDSLWSTAQFTFIALGFAVLVAAYLGWLTSLAARVAGRSWLTIFLAAAVLAVILPGFPVSSMVFLQPYSWKVLLVAVEYVILTWTLARFDLLTLTAALFTVSFLNINYTLLVLFRLTGAIGARVAFAVWVLVIAAAAAIAFQSALLSAYRRAAAALQ